MDRGSRIADRGTGLAGGLHRADAVQRAEAWGAAFPRATHPRSTMMLERQTRTLRRARAAVMVATLAGLLLAVGAPAVRGREESAVAGLHDITTDTESPPVFQAVLPHRRWALNPPEYDGPAAAALQRERFADIRPLTLPVPPTTVQAAVRRLIDARGWTRAGEQSDARESRLEAIAVTPWLRFRDDVVVRLRPAAEGTRVDMRSKSRIGNSDFGTNARRVREFLRDLEQAVRTETARP